MLPTVAIDAALTVNGGFTHLHAPIPPSFPMSPIDIKKATDARAEKVDIKRE
jgi:hypothetical protein